MLNDVVTAVLVKNDLVTAFAFIGLLVFISYRFSDLLTHGRIHGSALAITLGLVIKPTIALGFDFHKVEWQKSEP